MLNNPLAYTDPSGYFSFGKIFKSIFKAVTNLVTNPLALAAVAVAVAVPFIAPGLIAAAGTAFGIGGFAVNSTANVVLSGFIGGALSGAIGSGGDIKATFISALTAAAFAGVGEFTGHRPAFLSIEHIQNIVGHAAVGCASQAAGGGSCQAGALSAAAGSFVGPVTANAGFAGGLVITAAVGGTASAIGGGKFANGAVTAGYGYLFNSLLSSAIATMRNQALIAAGIEGVVLTDSDYGHIVREHSGAKPQKGEWSSFFLSRADNMRVYLGHAMNISGYPIPQSAGSMSVPVTFPFTIGWEDSISKVPTSDAVVWLHPLPSAGRGVWRIGSAYPVAPNQRLSPVPQSPGP